MSSTNGIYRARITSAAAALAATSEREMLIQIAAELHEAMAALLSEASISAEEVLAAREHLRRGRNGHSADLLAEVEQVSLSPVALAEALLFVAPEPLEVESLGRLLKLDSAEVQVMLDELEATLSRRGLRLQRCNGRLQLVSAPEAAPLIERLLGLQTSAKLSPAALETLAIVAYRQPASRAQIEAVRGVDCSGVLRALLARELIAEVGRAESVGRPILYGTTPEFLNQFGLQSLAELPPIDLPGEEASDLSAGEVPAVAPNTRSVTS